MKKRALVSSLFVAFLASGCALIVTETSEEQSDTNEPPDMAFTVSPTPADVGEFVELRASGTTDPDGDEMRHRFLVRGPDGDVVHRRDDRGASTEFRPERAGTYELRVRVLDEHGAASRTSIELEVANRAPRIEASWALFADGARTAYGSGSEGVQARGALDRMVARLDRVRDPDGHETTVQWIVENSPPGDSQRCEVCGGMEFVLDMSEPGVYEGRAVVRDQYGAATTFPFSVEKIR